MEATAELIKACAQIVHAGRGGNGISLELFNSAQKFLKDIIDSNFIMTPQQCYPKSVLEAIEKQRVIDWLKAETERASGRSIADNAVLKKAIEVISA